MLLVAGGDRPMPLGQLVRLELLASRIIAVGTHRPRILRAPRGLPPVSPRGVNPFVEARRLSPQHGIRDMERRQVASGDDIGASNRSLVTLRRHNGDRRASRDGSYLVHGALLEAFADVAPGRRPVRSGSATVTPAWHPRHGAAPGGIRRRHLRIQRIPRHPEATPGEITPTRWWRAAWTRCRTRRG